MILFILSSIAFLVLSWMLLSYGLLPLRYRWALVGILLLLQLFLGFIGLRKAGGRVGKVSVSVLLILLLCLYAGGSYYIKRGMDTLSKLSEQKEEEIHFSLVTLKESSLTYWEDIEKETIAAPIEQDKEKIDLFVKEVKDKTQRELPLTKVESYSQGAEDLLNGKTKVFLLNESYRNLIEEQVQQFSEKTKVIDLTKLQVGKVKVAIKNVSKQVESKESFNLYISGMDSYGDIGTTVSRSDVNLVLSVNPNTHKILITTIPRDSYLPIAGGGNDGYDKLTHAGVYGIESSIKTIENLLDIDINYYARINFTSLITMVDVLGGVEVENDQEFTALYNGTHFPKGKVYLNGEDALGFSRERYSLTSGDFDRGRNHSKVLSAMIEKAMSPSILLNYNQILQVVLESTDTNMPREKMIELINGQIDQGSKWDIKSQDIKGHTASGLPSYAMPNHNLSMVVLEANSLQEVKKEIFAVLNQDQ